MESCIFCDIIAKKAPADIVAESEEVLVFKDIKPEAPTHLLIVPKKHIPSLKEATEEDKELLAGALYKAKEVAAQLELKGYKVNMNVGRDAGQIVDHLHYHLLSW